MANSPVDVVSWIMEEDFGTRYLITDPRADRYLSTSKVTATAEKKFSTFCGGKGGWDDFCERIEE